MFYPKYVAGELGFAHFRLIMCYCSSIWNIPTGLPHLSFSLYCPMCLLKVEIGNYMSSENNIQSL